MSSYIQRERENKNLSNYYNVYSHELTTNIQSTDYETLMKENYLLKRQVATLKKVVENYRISS